MAVGELRIPTMLMVYDMTWAEFMLRLFAYNREQKTDWFKVREMAWASTIGPHLNPKRLPRNKEQFLPLNTRRNAENTVRMQERIQQVQREYYLQLNAQKNKKNGTP